MVRPGLILMAIIAAAVGLTSYGALGGSDLFTSDGATQIERAAVNFDRG